MELKSFIEKSLEAGKKKKDIENVLKKAGWQKEEIVSAFNQFADIDFPVPVPKRAPYVNAKEAFLLLITFTTLYIFAINLGVLWFQFVNKWFPDPASFQVFSPEAIRFALASLIIAFPIFLVVSWLKEKAFGDIAEKRQSKVNKWLTYITLFITAVIMIVDLIALVLNLLEGELSVRFLLKVLVVLIIAGTIFVFYLMGLRKGEKGVYEIRMSQQFKVLLGTIILLVTASVIGGLLLAGSPSQQRKTQLDTQRINDLQNISSTLDLYWNKNKNLPSTLESLRDSREFFLGSIVDPETLQPYSYNKLDSDTSELCATFDAPSEKRDVTEPISPYRRFQSDFWNHGVGYHCFTIDVIKDKE